MADTFPILTVKPDAESWTEKPAVDPTIRSEFENGAVQTRARFTAVPRMWDIRYHCLTQADKEALEEFERTVMYGAGAFSWYNHSDGKTYQVRFGALLSFQIEPENPMEWTADIQLIESFPNSGVPA